MAKWFENESVRKEEWRPGGDELVLDMKWMESKPPPEMDGKRNEDRVLDRMPPSGSLGVHREGPITWVLAGVVQMSW